MPSLIILKSQFQQGLQWLKFRGIKVPALMVFKFEVCFEKAAFLLNLNNNC